MKISLFKDLVKKILNLNKYLLFKKVELNTMVCHERLYNLYNLAEQIEKKRIGGAFVECGVWKGGASAVMTYVAEKYGSGRKSWLFDSFEGLPAPKEIDGEGAIISYEKDKIIASVEDVEKLFFGKLKFNKANINIVKGWFEDTLSKNKEKIGSIAILRLDGDWYESTMTCLDNLYDKVVNGGYIIIDDYGCWEGCKKAVDEFINKHKLNVLLIKIDKSGYYFQKK